MGIERNGKNYTIDWLTALKAYRYICATRKWDLYLCEKLMIARANSPSLWINVINLFQGVATWTSLHWNVLRTDRMLFSYC